MKKKLFIVLAMLFLMCPLFAKTTQCVKKYQCYGGMGDYGMTNVYDVTPQIQSMINQGWKVISITPISIKVSDSNPTDYVIVVFEMEE